MKSTIRKILIISFCLLSVNFTGCSAAGDRSRENILSEYALSLEEAEDIEPLIKDMENCHYVLLGEASHGTSEFYTWRAAITKNLIKEHGFSLIAIEGDWTSVYELNRYIKGLDHNDMQARQLLKESFQRWPPWMWPNEEFLEFIKWLREYNSERPTSEQVGVYGMDIYGFDHSIDEVINFIRKVDPEKERKIRNLYQVLRAHAHNTSAYISEVARTGDDESENLRRAENILTDNSDQYIANSSRKEYFNTLRNARVIKSAEAFYRKMIYRDERAWNARVENFTNTVEELMDFYPDSRIAGWAHNTHMGDARATEMHRRGRKNIGQMLKEKHSERVYITGFGTYRGRVAAGRQWGAEMEIMRIPESPPDTLEYLMFESVGDTSSLFLMRDIRDYEEFHSPLPHRAIGVVYNPRVEYPGNYVQTILPGRYDAFIFLPETKEVNSLHF